MRLRIAGGHYSPAVNPTGMLRGWHQSWAPCWGRVAVAIASHGALYAAASGEIGSAGPDPRRGYA